MGYQDNGLKSAKPTGLGQDISRQAGSNCIIELIQLRVTFDQLTDVKSFKPVNKNQFQSGKTSNALIAADIVLVKASPTPFQPNI